LAQCQQCLAQRRAGNVWPGLERRVDAAALAPGRQGRKQHMRLLALAHCGSHHAKALAELLG
jgi:hypothetical protein